MMKEMETMKVYAESDIQANSIARIVGAVKHYAPKGIEFVKRREDAALVIHTIVGVGNFDKQGVPIDTLIAQERERGQQYAMIQCCMASTEKPTAEFWGPLFAGAQVVWSYLDLRQIVPHKDYEFRFFYAPLGAEHAVFNRTRRASRDIMLVTTGYVAESEGILECSEAVHRLGGWHVHIGPDFKLGPHFTSLMNVTDERLATIYSRAQFVAGLRRCEGFELPAAEGLLCGARPIMFNAPHYRQWFDLWAEFVPESDHKTVVDALMQTIAHPRAVKVGQDESDEAAARFDWHSIVGSFWRGVLEQPIRAGAAEAVSQ
jgi:hypothetical protein